MVTLSERRPGMVGQGGLRGNLVVRLLGPYIRISSGSEYIGGQFSLHAYIRSAKSAQ